MPEDQSPLEKTVEVVTETGKLGAAVVAWLFLLGLLILILMGLAAKVPVP